MESLPRYLICGNLSRSFKAAENTPATAWIFGCIAPRRQVCPRACSISYKVYGRGKQEAPLVGASKGPRFISSLTGSTEVGLIIQRESGGGKRPGSNLLGIGRGKNPFGRLRRRKTSRECRSNGCSYPPSANAGQRLRPRAAESSSLIRFMKSSAKQLCARGRRKTQSWSC